MVRNIIRLHLITMFFNGNKKNRLYCLASMTLAYDKIRQCLSCPKKAGEIAKEQEKLPLSRMHSFGSEFIGKNQDTVTVSRLNNTFCVFDTLLLTFQLFFFCLLPTSFVSAFRDCFLCSYEEKLIIILKFVHSLFIYICLHPRRF